MTLEGLHERYVNFYTDFAFKKLFGTEANAEIARFNPNEQLEYEESLKAFRDWHSVLSTAQDKGFKAGREKSMAEGLEKGEKNKAIAIARDMLDDGMPLETISKYTHISMETLQRLLNHQ